MTIREYQSLAGQTDLITEEQFKQNHYYILGAAGEASELLDKSKKFYDTKVNYAYAEDMIRDIALEVGDCCWYAARELKALDGSPTDWLDSATDLQLAQGISITINGAVVLDAAINISVLAGLNADITKKMVRDRSNTFSLEIADALRTNCRRIIIECSRAASGLGMLFDNVLNMNVDKLASRMVRNMIHGSGDNR